MNPIENVIRDSISEVARKIENRCRHVLNWIDDGTTIVHPSNSAGDIALELRQLVDRNPSIRVLEFKSRAVLIPVTFQEAANLIVEGVDIRDTPRSEAILRYLEHVRLVSDQEIDIGVVFKGQFNSPAFEDEVTLSARSSLVEHLCELLGDDRELGFVILLDQTDQWLFCLH